MACPIDFGLASLHNCICQFLQINLFLHTHTIYVLYVCARMFLWRNLTDTNTSYILVLRTRQSLFLLLATKEP